MTDHWTFTWEAGPDAGGTTTVGHGSHIVGRAPEAAVRCDDPSLEAHHLEIEISTAGALVRQLTGRFPVRVDEEPVYHALMVESSARVEIGHSVLTMTRGDLTAPGQTAIPANITESPTGWVVMRRPRAAAEWNPDSIVPPAVDDERTQSSGGVLPALLALGGAGLVAVVFRQPMFLLFGMIGAFVAFGTWGGQRIG
jgi:S-DNA-T family DNA segregation ATPase FtsK/SpoIIIE